MYFMMITEVILSYRDNGLEGVWNFPRVPDNISLNSFDDTDDSDTDYIGSFKSNYHTITTTKASLTKSIQIISNIK
jgi:hypothetical protein